MNSLEAPLNQDQRSLPLYLLFTHKKPAKMILQNKKSVKKAFKKMFTDCKTIQEISINEVWVLEEKVTWRARTKFRPTWERTFAHWVGKGGDLYKLWRLLPFHISSRDVPVLACPPPCTHSYRSTSGVARTKFVSLLGKTKHVHFTQGICVRG